MAIPVNKFEELEDWSDALDYRVDIHLQLMKTKDPVKRKTLEALYKKAERVCDRLAKILCAQE